MNTTPRLSIIIPCYNEAAGLRQLLHAYSEIITRSDIEVIIVDNGSTDESATILEELLPQYTRFLKIVTVPHNQGYGFGIISGLKAAQGDFIGWTHGDSQTPPQDILKALSIIEHHQMNPKLYLKGARMKRPLIDNFFTVCMSIFETLLLRTTLSDINAQPNIFHRDFFSTWENPPFDFSLDLFALYHAKRSELTIIRFPVSFLPRTHGHSSWNTGLSGRYKFIKRTIIFSLSLRKRLK